MSSFSIDFVGFEHRAGGTGTPRGEKILARCCSDIQPISTVSHMANNNMANGMIVCCVLRSGGHYDVEYVERLMHGVKSNLDCRFICLSDVDVPCERIPLRYDWPGWWSKMELFRPDIEFDRFLYLDLDVVIVGSLDKIASVTVPAMLTGFVGSSIMMLPRSRRRQVWNRWNDDPSAHMFFHDGSNVNHENEVGDQGFLRANFTWASLYELCPGEITHYLLTSRVPGKSVVVFNQWPRPRDVDWNPYGYKIQTLRLHATV